MQNLFGKDLINHWTELSIKYANQRNYLDDLFVVYPTIPEGIREINGITWTKIEYYYDKNDHINLLKCLLKLNLFPIKDSYVAYLKRDPKSFDRNPKTVNRLCGRLYEMGLDKIYKKCSEPKETNRQIGPLFRRWLKKNTLGVPFIEDPIEFLNTSTDAIFLTTDNKLKKFARENLNYRKDKSLDLVAKFNGKYIIGEAKFLTDFGGHQNAQFNDAIAVIATPNVNAVKIAILDGVLYIPNRGKMFNFLLSHNNYNILSALVLREFLYQV